MIECKVYRWLGHHAGDPAKYRPEGELEAWKERCPLKLFAKRLIADGIMDEDRNKQILESANAEMLEAADWGMQQPWPLPEDALEDVYA